MAAGWGASVREPYQDMGVGLGVRGGGCRWGKRLHWAPMSIPAAVAHYEVERELGRGAMGVVYLARDPRLGRAVAIKALPAEVARDAARRSRFEHEARTLAAISHPNIAAIFGIEEAEGSAYLVLEFIEGRTLADELWDAWEREGDGCTPRGALEVREALRVCGQIAAGIEAAHERGVIHRDLKPENVKVRPDGLVKVLDFGIAMSGATEAGASSKATVVGPARQASTYQGGIVGTPGYMSPEQARGRPLGRATDVWSLGCVLYECLSGRLAFPGETLADAIAATLLTEPDWGALPARTPARVLELLRASLEKDYRKRLGDCGKVREELERAAVELANPGAGVRLSISIGAEGGGDEWSDLPGNMPAVRGALVGREREAQELGRAVLGSRLVTLAGVEGTGKTALVLHSAAALREGHRSGVWWCPVRPVGDRGFVARSAALSLGARVRAGAGGPAPVRQALVDRIAARPMVLVLDGCHHAPAACADLATALVRACPNLRVLATGREALDVQGGARVGLGGLRAAEGEEESEAGRVFAERASAAGKGWRASDADTPVIAGLCRDMRGLPLPIALAAGVIGWSAISAAEGAGRMESHFAGKGAVRPADQPADQMVRLVVSWVFDGLPESDRGLLRRVSLFAGAFSVRAAAAVSGAADSFPDPVNASPGGGPATQTEGKVGEQLARLEARSLLVSENAAAGIGGVRYWLPDSVREHVRGHLLAASGALAVARRHVQYSLAVVEQAAARLGGEDGAAWASILEAEYPSAQALMEFAASTRDQESADRFKAVIEKFCAVRGV